MAVVTLATAIKGYAGILALGLLLAMPTRKTFLRGALPAALVSLAVTLPVAPHLLSGFGAMLKRNEFAFIPVWYNHSFKSLYFHVSPTGSDNARRYLLAFAAAVCFLTWWRLASAMRRGNPAMVTCRSILFASSALAFTVGMPVYSGPYNYLLVLPGLLLLATSFDSFATILRIGRRLAVPLGLCTAVALALALQMRWLGSDVPLAGIALVYLLVVLCVLALVPARRIAN